MTQTGARPTAADTSFSTRPYSRAFARRFLLREVLLGAVGVFVTTYFFGDAAFSQKSSLTDSLIFVALWVAMLLPYVGLLYRNEFAVGPDGIRIRRTFQHTHLAWSEIADVHDVTKSRRTTFTVVPKESITGGVVVTSHSRRFGIRSEILQDAPSLDELVRTYRPVDGVGPLGTDDSAQPAQTPAAVPMAAVVDDPPAVTAHGATDDASFSIAPTTHPRQVVVRLMLGMTACFGALLALTITDDTGRLPVVALTFLPAVATSIWLALKFGRTRITLDHQGITIQQSLRRHVVPWERVEEIRVAHDRESSVIIVVARATSGVPGDVGTKRYATRWGAALLKDLPSWSELVRTYAPAGGPMPRIVEDVKRGTLTAGES